MDAIARFAANGQSHGKAARKGAKGQKRGRNSRARRWWVKAAKWALVLALVAFNPLGSLLAYDLVDDD